MNYGSIAAHVEALKDRHKDLDKRVDEGYTSRIPDDELRELKLKRLQLKDTIVKAEKDLESCSANI